MTIAIGAILLMAISSKASIGSKSWEWFESAGDSFIFVMVVAAVVLIGIVVIVAIGSQ